MEVYVIRHTAVAVESGTCYGQSDVALASNYSQHIQDVKTKLPLDFDQVISSPSTRCSILAKYISNTTVVYKDCLMEMNFGDWENRTWENIDPTTLNKWMEDFVYTKTPNGESLELLYQRVIVFIEELRKQPHQKIAVVTHAGVIRCLWAMILNIPLENIFKIPVNYGDGFVFKLDTDKNLDQIIKTFL